MAKVQKVTVQLKYHPSPRQCEAHAAPERYVLFGGSMAAGKASNINDLVCTPFGFKRMGDIKIDDQVSNPDGSVARVIGVWPQGEQDLYEMTFVDGAKCRVTLDHLWKVKIASKRRFGKRPKGAFTEYKLMYTRDLIRYLDERKNYGKSSFWPLIPLSEPVQFTKPIGKGNSPKILDPYVLGYLLGNGALTIDGRVRFSTIDEYVVKKFKQALHRSITQSKSKSWDYDILDAKLLIADLKKLGVYGHYAHEKFIPGCYKFADLKTRYEIINGLMDSDGYVDERGHCVFYSTSKQMAEDVQWIIRSLGGKATLTEKEGKYRKDTGEIVNCRICYCIYIQTKKNSDLFQIARKKDRCIDSFNGGVSELHRRLVDIKYWGKEQAQCITVNHPNGLYITNDFIVTHNSVFIVNECINLMLDIPGNQGFLGRWENKSFKMSTYVTLLEYLPQELIKVHHKTDQYIQLFNDSVLYYGGLKSSGSSDGGSKTIIDKIKSMNLGFFALDEASEVPKDLFLVFCSRLDRGLLERLAWEQKIKKEGPNPKDRKIYHPPYKGLLTSNPEPGWLREMFIDQQIPDHKFIKALPSDNPYLPPSYVEGLRKQFPPHWVKRYLEGDWDAKTGNDYLFNYNTIVDSMCSEIPQEEWDANALEYSPEFGVDVAEFGGDRTVIYVKQGKYIRLCYESEKTDLMEATGAIGQIVDDYGDNAAPIKIDAVGIGAGVASRLEELGRNVIRIIGGESAEEAEDGTLFFNKRSQLYWEAKEKLEKGELVIEEDSELKSELASIKFKRQSDKKIKVESKSEMKKRGLRSPDKADAFIYAVSRGDYQPSIYFI